MPKLKEVLFGGKNKVKKASLLTKEQQDLYNLIQEGLENGTGPFADIFNFNEEAFQKGVSEPAMKQFKEQTLPELQEKFIGGGAAYGSGRQRAEGRAATDLQSKLAELMYGARNQTAQNKLTGAQTLLGKQGTENIYEKAAPGLVQETVKGFAEGAGKAATMAIAG